MDSISKIMTKNIEKDLGCLENNLYLFIKLIKTDRPGYLKQESLEIYLDKNEKAVSQETLNILSAMFQLSSLLFGDVPGYIAKENVGKLSHLLVDINQIIVNGQVFHYFSDDEKVTYAEHNRRKSMIYNSFVRVGKLIGKAIKIDGNKNEINFLELIKKFKNNENAKYIRYTENLLFLKKAILGGQNRWLNSQQLKRLMKLLGETSKVFYDVLKLPQILKEEHEIEEIVTILKEGTQTVLDNLILENPNEVILNYDIVKAVIIDFAPEWMKFYKYKKSILKLKEVFVGNRNENFTVKEIKTILHDIVLVNLSKGVFAYRSYLNNTTFMGKIHQIYRKVKNLIIFEGEDKYTADLNRIVRKYRFYHGNAFAPFFGFDFKRNPKGLFDILIYEDIVTRFFKTYGTPDDSAVNGYILTKEQLRMIMHDFSEVFEGEGYLLPGRSVNTADTIMMMTSLFHFQSNGDSRIEIPELVEFFVTLTAAIKVSEANQLFLKGICPEDEQGRVHPKCFRDNLQSFLISLTKSGEEVGEHLPLLMNYVEKLGDQSSIDEYLIATTLFSRVCHRLDDVEIPMKGGDFIVTWAGLLVIEQSMLKFDEDNSGILELYEVEKAFQIYKNAIRGLLPAFKDSKILAKVVFKYLVTFNRAPEFAKVTNGVTFWKWIKESTHFGGFFLKSIASKDRRDHLLQADRMTFASVLKVIARNSPVNRANPYDCSFLLPSQ